MVGPANGSSPSTSSPDASGDSYFRVVDLQAASRANRELWDAMAAGWGERHTYFEETARPVVDVMLERLAPRPGDVVVELAAGTGVVGFAAAPLVGPEGRVVVSDFAPAMVRVAERLASSLALENVRCRVLDAEHLDLPDQSADGVLCRWGYMLMPDAPAALRETRRVLRAGGRLSCAVFGDPAENPWVTLPMRVLHERGHVGPPQAGTPGILALADRDRFGGLLTESGFTAVQFDEVRFSWRFESVDEYWAFLTDAAGAIATVLAALDDRERRAVRDELSTMLAPYGPDEIGLPALVVVASAS
jgi:SAM-dependent methyltransferase